MPNLTQQSLIVEDSVNEASHTPTIIKSEKPKRGRPKSLFELPLKPRQIKRPQIGIRCSEQDYLTLKYIAINPKLGCKTMTEFYSEMLLKYLTEKPWLNPKYNYDEVDRGKSFFKKSPTPIKTKDITKVPKSKPQDVILRTLDLTHVRSPSGRMIHQETMRSLFSYACKLLMEEKSAVNMKTKKIYVGTPAQIAEQAIADAEAAKKYGEPKYWAEQIRLDSEGKEYVAKGTLSEATVAYSMMRWLLDTVYSEDVPSSQHPKAIQYNEKSKFDDKIIFGVDRGFDLYSIPVTEDEMR